MRYQPKKKPSPLKKSNQDVVDISSLIAAWAKGVVRSYYRIAV